MGARTIAGRWRCPALVRHGLICLVLSSFFLVLTQDATGEAASVTGFATEPAGDVYAARLAAFLELHQENTGFGVYGQAARLYLGLPPEEAPIRRALDKMDARLDCADFGMHGVLRILYQFGSSPLLGEALRGAARDSLLGFKYWPDEPGVDSMCSWSENHFILFAAGGYLAGQLYPDEVFTNSGQTGREKMAVCRPRILRWLDLRYQTGFSEWLSHVYYDEDLIALLNLTDFCEDEEIARKAAMVTDLLLADMALNSYRGVFGSTHGRSYENQKKHAAAENTGTVMKLISGMNRFSPGSMSGVCLALSPRYRVPAVLEAMAQDGGRAEMLNRQRVGIRLKEAERWGLDGGRMEDGMTLLTLEAYSHPRTINLMLKMMDTYGWWENSFFEGFAARKPMIDRARRWGLMPWVARYYKKDLTRNLREEADLYTYRTPDYMLSSVQDYRKGYGGDQQHIWQATLAPEAVCFTTHPGQYDREEIAYGSPGYWTGSGSLPRAAQVENVLIALYRIHTRPGLYLTHKLRFTHAWLPQEAFDEVVERKGWVFARKGDGYLALWSQQPTRWQTEGEERDKELIAEGKENIWICELGRRETDGRFEEFIDRIERARIRTEGLEVAYQSPSQGRLRFGWRGPLRQNGKVVGLHPAVRYENPYGAAAFPGVEIAFRLGGEWLRLDWTGGTREASSWLSPEETTPSLHP